MPDSKSRTGLLKHQLLKLHQKCTWASFLSAFMIKTNIKNTFCTKLYFLLYKLSTFQLLFWSIAIRKKTPYRQIYKLFIVRQMEDKLYITINFFSCINCFRSIAKSNQLFSSVIRFTLLWKLILQRLEVTMLYIIKHHLSLWPLLELHRAYSW